MSDEFFFEGAGDGQPAGDAQDVDPFSAAVAEQPKDNEEFLPEPQGPGPDPEPELGGQHGGDVKQEEDKTPTPYSIWEQKRADVLKARQDKADADKADLVLKAKDELKNFYSSREEKLEKTKKQHRQDEASEAKETAALMESGTRWQKVNKLVDLKPKKDHAESQRTERFRNLLIQLKNQRDPDERDHKGD